MYEDLDSSQPLVLLLGNVAHEGILSSLVAAGRQYKLKLLDSSIENWHKILEYFDVFSVKAVLAKLTPHSYNLLADGDYAAVVDQLLDRISAVPHVVFTFESLLDPTLDDSLSGDFLLPDPNIRVAVNDLLRKHRINLIPYRRNAEVTVMSTAFVADIEEGLLFRVYVPSGRMWAEETSRLRRRAGRRYRYVYGAGNEVRGNFIDNLVKLDLEHNATSSWYEEGCYPGEPVFVATPEAGDEDNGVLLSVVLDAKKAASFLLILDASSFRELARAEVSHHIPFGFHGNYFAETSGPESFRDLHR